MTSSRLAETGARACTGVALVGVLWLLALLALIGLNVSASSRIELQLTANLKQAAAARHAADAGINWAIWSLLQTGTAGWLADGSEREFELDGMTIRIALFDEQGKIDLNEAGPELLLGLLLAVEVEEDRALALSEAIQDWRDEDDERRPKGAEADDYLALGLKGPGNRPFERLAELRRVLGMNDELYDRLAPTLTLLSNKAEVNPLLAPPQVLRALPGLSEDRIEQYVAERRRNYAEGAPPPPLGEVDANLLSLTSAGFNYAVDIEVMANAQSLSRQRVWLSRRGQGLAAGFRVQHSMPEQ
ncbi:general secretion pathway protein GspK [Pseudomonas sp. AOB-7]|uniref:general secretion pathway protein GspK n=1 Tax=Pseudomonas sp. AOB-7 TaxID=2482750 RepID=UPI000EFDAE2C|nr:type II secretion system protein GspK [Pseudomonas sp. AOB-7]RMH82989.1 general secretion pathway protein GspK [Pseudomonas sp. AOB-7]